MKYRFCSAGAVPRDRDDRAKSIRESLIRAVMPAEEPSGRAIVVSSPFTSGTPEALRCWSGSRIAIGSPLTFVVGLIASNEATRTSLNVPPENEYAWEAELITY